MIDNVQQKNNSIQGKPEKKASLLLPIIVAAVIFATMVVSICVSGNITKVVPEDDDFTTCFQIDSIEIKEDILEISGWCFKLDESTTELEGRDFFPELNVILFDPNNSSGTQKVMETVSRIPREDVNNYFKCEYDYTNCGFCAKISLSKLDVKDTTYEILIQYDKTSDKAILTNCYINNGKMMYVNPNKFEKINVPESSVLRNVIDNGYLLSYRQDVGLYIYQLDNNLYWITNTDFDFNETGLTFIQYQLYTTQILKLPMDRIDHGWYWDNLSGNFEDYEINTGCEDYRCSMRKLPEDYSITNILTGYCEESTWIWKQKFRPRYYFE